MEPRDHLTVGVDLASKALRSIYPPGHCGPNHYTTPPNPPARYRWNCVSDSTRSPRHILGFPHSAHLLLAVAASWTQLRLKYPLPALILEAFASLHDPQ